MIAKANSQRLNLIGNGEKSERDIANRMRPRSPTSIHASRVKTDARSVNGEVLGATPQAPNEVFEERRADGDASPEVAETSDAMLSLVSHRGTNA